MRNPDLIHTGWLNYAQDVLGPNVSDVQYEESRKAYMAGAWALFKAMDMAANADLSEAAELKFMEGLSQETSGFMHEASNGVYIDRKGQLRAPRETMPSWVIHRHPTDMPDKWVARLFIGAKHTTICLTGDTQAEVEARVSSMDALMPARVFFNRAPSDAACIVGSWV